MDIGSIRILDEDSGISYHVKDPAGNPEYFDNNGTKTPIVFVLMGTFSRAFRDAVANAQEKRTDLARKGEELTTAEEEAIGYASEAACIKSWVFTAHGKPLPITGENWQAVAAKRPDWRLQLLGEMNNHERFFAASSAP